MGVLHVFKIVQIVPNREKSLILLAKLDGRKESNCSLIWSSLIVIRSSVFWYFLYTLYVLTMYTFLNVALCQNVTHQISLCKISFIPKNGTLQPSHIHIREPFPSKTYKKYTSQIWRYSFLKLKTRTSVNVDIKTRSSIIHRLYQPH